MSTPKKVVGQLSLAGLIVALLGCGGASPEPAVTLVSTQPGQDVPLVSTDGRLS